MSLAVGREAFAGASQLERLDKFIGRHEIIGLPRLPLIAEVLERLALAQPPPRWKQAAPESGDGCSCLFHSAVAIEEALNLARRGVVLLPQMTVQN